MFEYAGAIATFDSRLPVSIHVGYVPLSATDFDKGEDIEDFSTISACEKHCEQIVKAILKVIPCYANLLKRYTGLSYSCLSFSTEHDFGS
jgi:hypothetical protein